MAPRRPPQHLRRLLLSLVVCVHALLCTPAVSSGGGALRGQACAQHLRRAGAVRMGFFDDVTNAVSNFGDELDRFIVCCCTSNLIPDDAAGRRLGNGAKFYGKRRSSFYGEEDANRKTDPDAFDAEEDWRGPQGGSYFVPSPEKDEKGRPLEFLTRREYREYKAKEKEGTLSAEGQDLVGAFRKATEEDRAEQ